MMRRHAFFACALLFAACAQVRDITGGPKDTTPPELLIADPPDGTLHFAAKRIKLRFNERITLDHAREKLLISPPLITPPDVQVIGGDEVVIVLHDALKDSTTYNFNIGDAVVDLSEGNPASGITYVVSTGDHLDSLMVNGSVRAAPTDDPEAGILVMLHPVDDTLGLANGRPAYFTRTDKDGAFSITHLPAGHFKLSALRDQNADYRYDLPNEDVAFVDSVIDPAHCGPQAMRSFREPPSAQNVLEAKVQADRGWRIVLARSAKDPTLRDIDREGGSLTWRAEWNATRDTALFWPSDTALLDGDRFAIADTGAVIDTITYRVVAKMPFYVDVRSTSNNRDTARTFITSRPIARMDIARATLIVDSAQVPFNMQLDTSQRRTVRLLARISDGKNAVLRLLPKTFTDIYAGVNDTTTITFGPHAMDQLGALRLTLMPDSTTSLTPTLILRLLDDKNAVVREQRIDALPATAAWPDLPAAAYRPMLIEDRDHNGRWTTGDWHRMRQPERVFRRKDPINVRAGWDVEETWPVKE